MFKTKFTPITAQYLTEPLPAERQQRRRLLQLGSAALLLSVRPALAGNTQPPTLLSVRIWPAGDYTRITLESDLPLSYNSFSVKDPERLVLDIEGITLAATKKNLSGKVNENDPYIKLLRAGVNQPGSVRLVIDLKQAIKPQLNKLAPVGEYGHRLVVDLYPENPVDPLLGLLDDKHQTPAEYPTEKPALEPSDTNNDTPPPRRMITIMIDPGHGGEDPGAVGKSGLYEKTVVLSIAKLLQEHINAQPNMRAALTRDADFFVPLGDRVKKARKINADLFISVHADAFLTPAARGSSVFALSEHGATSTAAKWLAKEQNNADSIGGVSMKVDDPFLRRTLFDLTQTATISDSLKLGNAVLAELGGVNTLHKNAVEQASFAVLKAPDIPSILIETAFISNPEEEAKLRDPDYQTKMAKAIVQGLRRYFVKNPPLSRGKLAKADL